MLAMCLSGLCVQVLFYLIACLRWYSFQLSKTQLEELIELKEGRKEGTYLSDQTTIQYIFMKMQWSGDCR